MLLMYEGGVILYVSNLPVFMLCYFFSFYTFLQTKQSEPAYYATQSAIFHFWLLVVVHWKKKRVLIVVACAWWPRYAGVLCEVLYVKNLCWWELLFCLNWPPWHVVLWLRWWKINAFTLFWKIKLGIHLRRSRLVCFQLLVDLRRSSHT